MKVILYGAGKNCDYFLDNSNVECVCVADRDSAKVGGHIKGHTIISPEDILKYAYDKVIVTVKKGYNAIKDKLIEIGVPEEKIANWTQYICVGPRNTGSIKLDWDSGIAVNDIYDEICKHKSEMNEMERFFYLGKHRRSFKWAHYFEAYNKHFGNLLGKDVNILEIGVQKGGSMQLWKEVFGPKSKIYGVDIQERCKAYEDDQTTIFIGNQEDRNF